MAQAHPFGTDANDPFAIARGRFGKPSTSFENITEYKNRLLLITPTLFQEGIETSFGAADAVTADVVVLDGDDAPLELSGVMIFQKVLVGQLKRRIGHDPVLGILVQKPSTKPGMSPAWVLDPDMVGEDDIDVAVAYVKAKEQDGGLKTNPGLPPSRLVPDRSGSPIEQKFWDAVQRLRPPHLEGLVQQHELFDRTVRLDFALPEYRLGIELDGFETHGKREVFIEDRRRDRDLSTALWVVIHFAGHDINRNVDRCVREADDWARAWIEERS